MVPPCGSAPWSTPTRPLIRVSSRSADGPFLTARLEGALVAVRVRDRDSVICRNDQELRADRDDDRTAAHLLQAWLERL